MKRSTLLLVVLGFVLLTAVWYVFFINPKRGEISDIDADIQATQDMATLTQVEIAALKDIRDSELTYQVANAEVLRSIPATPELASFIDDLNALADETSVDLSSVNPSPPGVVEGQPFQALGFTLDAQGQFFEMLGFLYGLQDMERLVKIDGLTMSVSTSEDATQEVVASIRGSIFTLATSLPPPTLELPEEAPPPAEEEPAEGEEEATEEEAAAATGGDT